MVFATPGEWHVLSIIGKLVAVLSILLLVWNFMVLFIEGLSFVGQCADVNTTRARWSYGVNVTYIMLCVLYLSVYYVF